MGRDQLWQQGFERECAARFVGGELRLLRLSARHEAVPQAYFSSFGSVLRRVFNPLMGFAAAR